MHETVYLIIATVDGMPEINFFNSLIAAQAFAEDLKMEGVSYRLAEELEKFQGLLPL